MNFEPLKTVITDLPFVSSNLPGIGGTIKAVPEHFCVEETLPYAPCGEGEHVFITVRRQGWNTADVGRALGRALGAKGTDVGWGGRKDKNAVTVQTFSILLPLSLELAEIEKALQEQPFDILDLKRHCNKLKMGHVAANRFRITLSGVEPSAINDAEAIAEALLHSGIPNFYGGQRFGREMKNLDRAQGLFKRSKAHGRKDQFLVSSVQSALFNFWLKERMERDEFNTIINGDLAKKTDTGGMFTVDDLEEASQRFKDRKIVYTGPIFGHKMRMAADRAGALEAGALETFELKPDIFKPLRAPGSRRVAILFLDDLAIQQADDGLEFSFTLPSGAYATTVMREFTRKSDRMGI